MQRLTNSDGLSDSEHEAKKRAEWAEQDKAHAEFEKAQSIRQDYFANLKPNTSFTEIKEHVGNPDSTDFINGKYVTHYDDLDAPMILVFDGKENLVGWESDRETIKNREQRRQHREDLAAEEEIARKNRRSAALTALSQGLQNAPRQQPYMIQTTQQKSFNCTSSSYGNQTQTNCY